jgi:hypothetical protein
MGAIPMADIVSADGKPLTVNISELVAAPVADKPAAAAEISDVTKARNILREMQDRQDNNGPVLDDRLETQINQIKRDIKAMEVAEGQNDELDAETRSYEAKENPTYSGELAAAAKPIAAKASLVDPTEFVTAPNGTNDFGAITLDMSKATRRQAGKILLRQGNDACVQKNEIA